MFVIRSLAYAIGSISIKYFVRYYSTQTLFLVNYAALAISLFLCSLSISVVNITTMLFIASFTILSLTVMSFGIILTLYEKDRP